MKAGRMRSCWRMRTAVSVSYFLYERRSVAVPSTQKAERGRLELSNKVIVIRQCEAYAVII